MCIWIYTQKVPVQIVFASLWVKGWASRSCVPAQALLSVFTYCSKFSNLWIAELWQTLCKTLVQPLQPRGAQKASLLFMWLQVSWLQSPSWPQSRPVIFLKISVTIILFHLGYDWGKLSSKAFGVISCTFPWLGNRISCCGPEQDVFDKFKGRVMSREQFIKDKA